MTLAVETGAITTIEYVTALYCPTDDKMPESASVILTLQPPVEADSLPFRFRAFVPKHDQQPHVLEGHTLLKEYAIEAAAFLAECKMYTPSGMHVSDDGTELTAYYPHGYSDEALAYMRNTLKQRVEAACRQAESQYRKDTSTLLIVPR